MSSRLDLVIPIFGDARRKYIDFYMDNIKLEDGRGSALASRLYDYDEIEDMREYQAGMNDYMNAVLTLKVLDRLNGHFDDNYLADTTYRVTQYMKSLLNMFLFEDSNYPTEFKDKFEDLSVRLENIQYTHKHLIDEIVDNIKYYQLTSLIGIDFELTRRFVTVMGDTE